MMTNSIIEELMKDKDFKWLEPDEYKKLERLLYLNSFSKPLPSKCPECNNQLDTTIDEDETICSHCGLITSMSIEYVAGFKIKLPHGRH